MITVAVETGIPPQAWLDAGERAITTAIDILTERAKARGGEP